MGAEAGSGWRRARRERTRGAAEPSGLGWHEGPPRWEKAARADPALVLLRLERAREAAERDQVVPGMSPENRMRAALNALYDAGAAFMLTLGWEPAGENFYAGVARFLRSEMGEEGRTAGEAMLGLQRRLSETREEPPISRAEGSAAVQTAKEFVDLVCRRVGFGWN